jgi:hypothetical protein
MHVRLVLSCLVGVFAFASAHAHAEPIWCGTSVNPPVPHYTWGAQARPTLTPQLAIHYVTVDQVQDARAHAVLDSNLSPDPCSVTGSWDVSLIVAPNGMVLAATTSGIGDGSCIADQLRPARFEHSTELRTITARVTVALVVRAR